MESIPITKLPKEIQFEIIQLYLPKKTINPTHTDKINQKPITFICMIHKFFTEIHVHKSIQKIHQKTLKGHTDNIECLTYSSDGKTIVSGSDDLTVKIWDALDGSLIKT